MPEHLGGPLPEGYNEVEVGFIKFEKPGDNVEGRLLVKDTTKIRDGKVGKYLVELPGGIKATFLGGTHIDDLMRNVALGQHIYLVYTHEEPVGDSGNKIKRFRLGTKQQ